jgi:hypothetical protein
MQRYQKSTHGLNNIRKVCILPDMLMDGLTRAGTRGVASAGIPT